MTNVDRHNVEPEWLIETEDNEQLMPTESSEADWLELTIPEESRPEEAPQPRPLPTAA